MALTAEGIVMYLGDVLIITRVWILYYKVLSDVPLEPRGFSSVPKSI